MARTKRKINPIRPEAAAPASAGKTYRTVGYVRLSIEDGGRPGADTLESQKRLITNYIENIPSLTLVGLWCDNGHTGTNFERPEFERLMERVRHGEIDCIVVKDLSRFGRNYKETGNYLERIFPFLNVRFIAINDNFDTLTAERNEYGFIVPLKNLMNETYSRDISQKISSAIASKEKRGEFIGVWAPYGYKKSETDRHHLEINEDTASVVREIFTMRLTGMGYTGIVRKLNERGVLSPSAYLYRVGLSRNEKYRDTLWTPWNVKEILQNEVYLGHLVQGKRTQQSYKQARKERYAPSDEWRITKNAHEAIIDEQTFRSAQELSKERSEAYFASLENSGGVKTPNMFSRLVYCADCGKALSRRQVYSNWQGKKVYYYSYLCLTSLNKSSACSPKNLKERELLEIVGTAIRRHIDAVTDLEKRVKVIWEAEYAARKHTLESQITAAERELTRSQALYDGLYQSLVDGIVTRQEYTAMKRNYRTLCDECAEHLDTLKRQHKELERCSPVNPMFAEIRKFQSIEGLPEELIHALITRIEVSDNSELHITFNYQDEFEALTHFIAEAAV
jgi:DNA invertase Pin-like site-specific DNA recombinase